ncbi:unnamed protein product, partial [Mesorhabditis belari]|uniref:Uncharacterized protein n=1 Tax=Mesorhabditis belari TaxID=2138241 RepID=A0AAF3F8M4_9BILA
MGRAERVPLKSEEPPPGDGKIYDGVRLKPNPAKTANVFSRIFFWYMGPLFLRGFRHNLESSDMFEPLPDQESKAATEQLRTAWQNEQKEAKEKEREASLMRAIFKAYGRELTIYGVWLFLEEAIKLSQPLFMGRLIRYFRFDTPLTQQDAFLSAAGVAITGFIVVTIHHPYFYGLQRIGLKIKIAASGLLSEKGFGLSSAALRDTSVGHLVNLLSTDVMKFDMAFVFFHYLWVSPLLLIGYGCAIWSQIGVICLAGFGAYFLLFPIQKYISTKMGIYRRSVAMRTDKRISLMNEILNGIRLIKMYSWEDAFADIVKELRTKEMDMIRKQASCQSLLMGLFWPSGKMVVLFVALAYYLQGELLLAEPIFVASALFNSCRLPVMLFLPIGIAMFQEARVSAKRIQTFLDLDDFNAIEAPKEERVEKDDGVHYELTLNGTSEKKPLIDNGNGFSTMDSWCHLEPESSKDAKVILENFSATWESPSEWEKKIANPEAPMQAQAIKDISVTVTKGKLVGVIGPVGAGKSSLLASVLRETTRTAGKLTVHGKVAYCSQDAWIFGGTIRDNVLFGKAYNAELYEEVIEMSALKQDLAEIQNGDQNIVGDRGLALSGGQRARLALARALYSQADIYLLDDPLSAVDAAVGRFIFDKCIRQYLKEKVVILVTHQLQFVGKADEIVLMKDGAVAVQGTPKELRESNSKIVLQLMHETARTYGVRRSVSVSSGHSNEPEEFDEEEVFDENFGPKLEEIQGTSEPSGQIEEDRAEGAVPWSVYWRYITAMGTCQIIPALLFTFFVQILFNFTDFWLNLWTTASEKVMKLTNITAVEEIPDFKDNINFFGHHISLSLDGYMWIFAVTSTIVVISSVLRCVWVRLLETVASETLHKEMFHAVVNTETEFYDTNPIGRVLNRFSKDIHTMDEPLAFVFFEFILGVLAIIGSVAMIFFVNPWIFLICIPLCLLFWVVRALYLATSRDVKRLEAITRSPLYTHISSVMQVIHDYHGKMNINSAAFILTLTTSRWFAVQIDLIVTLFVSFVAFACVLSPMVFSSGEVALMLVYAIQLTGFFSWIMRQSAELQNGMVSVERIVNFCGLPNEHAEEGLTKIPAHWPSQGEIKFDNFSLQYRDVNQFALQEISVQIASHQKIGVVGRTGAGKSSLLRALFRMNKKSTGKIYIDGVDIASIPLRDLRAHLAIIPQEPVLFVGTLRRNLDPFNEHSDEDLWTALEQVELKDAVAELNGKLQAEMNEGGANFSVGQRQLVCLARALLRNSKILVIDEATANVDLQTDALIQKTIRKRFAESTVLTIAHRLHTIMDSDRVMVLQDGRVVEFDHPYLLLSNPESTFSALANETGRDTAAQLLSVAKATYEAQN